MSSVIKFSRLPSQGVVYGIDAAGITVISIAALFSGGAVISNGFLGLLLSLPVSAPLAALGVIHVYGQSLITHLAYEVLGKGKQLMGKSTYRRDLLKVKMKPVAKKGTVNKPAASSLLDIPGREGRLYVYETPAGYAVLWDARKQTGTFYLDVATLGLGLPTPEMPTMLSDKDREALIYQWARVLGSWTLKEHIVAISVLEHTRPVGVEAEKAYFVERSTAQAAISDSYKQMMQMAEESAVQHQSVLAITFNLTGEAKAMVKGSKSRSQGMLAIADLEIQSVVDALTMAGFSAAVPFVRRDLGLWSRQIIDPGAMAGIDGRKVTEWAGVDPRDAVPMFLDDKRTVVESDSAYHRSFWVQEWPRYETYPGFLSKLVFVKEQTGRPVRHTFNLVASPVLIRDAMKRLTEEKRTWNTNASLRAKAGRPDSAADAADWAAIVEHEQDLVAGQGELRFSAFITVTADDLDTLEKHTASMMNAMAQTGLEPRVVPWQQAEVLLNAAYPVGLGVK